MNCNDYQRMINKFIDSDMRATESADLFRHLGGCAQCREFMDTLMKLNMQLDKVFRHDESDSVPGERQRFPAGRRSFSNLSLRLKAPQNSTTSRIHLRSSTATLILLSLFLIGVLFSMRIEVKPPTDLVPATTVTP